jgi:hypothetical protein
LLISSQAKQLQFEGVFVSSIWLSWREAQGEELPMVCATCGEKAVEMVERKLRTIRPGLMCIVKTTVRVVLPYCEEHIRASWNGWVRVRAKSIVKDGITLTQVSESFVDAVEDYRTHPSDLKLPRRARDAEISDDDCRRPLRRRPAPRSNTPWIIFAVMILVALIVVGTCGFGLLFLNLKPGGPGRPGFKQPAVPNDPGPAKAPWRR